MGVAYLFGHTHCWKYPSPVIVYLVIKNTFKHDCKRRVFKAHGQNCGQFDSKFYYTFLGVILASDIMIGMVQFYLLTNIAKWVWQFYHNKNHSHILTWTFIDEGWEKVTKKESKVTFQAYEDFNHQLHGIWELSVFSFPYFNAFRWTLLGCFTLMLYQQGL